MITVTIGGHGSFGEGPAPLFTCNIFIFYFMRQVHCVGVLCKSQALIAVQFAHLSQAGISKYFRSPCQENHHAPSFSS